MLETLVLILPNVCKQQIGKNERGNGLTGLIEVSLSSLVEKTSKTQRKQHQENRCFHVLDVKLGIRSERTQSERENSRMKSMSDTVASCISIH